jgi:hypothetical protein
MIPLTDWEVRESLNELYDGRKVVIPSSIDHARFMLQVAQAYINEDKQKMIDILKS